MSLKNMKKEDLELLSYSDLAELVIDEEKEKNTADLFKKIIELLDMPNSAFENKIGDFFTALTNDKRFILLDSGNWGLRKNYKVADLINESDIEDDEIEEDSYDEIIEEDEEDPFDEDTESNSDVSEEYKNLVIVDEEDLELEQ